MSEPIDINQNKPHFNVLAVCFAPKWAHDPSEELCLHRWIGTVMAQTSLFKLECPVCGAQNSFASFIPHDYLELV